jgi:hypothetical protein
MRWLIRLYPRRWRKRYGGELEAMLEQTSLTPRIMFDLVAGALDARLYPQLTSEGAVVHNPFTKTPAVLPQAIMLPGLIWLAAGVLNFEPLEASSRTLGSGYLRS